MTNQPSGEGARADRVVLVGMMGAGKTAVGRRLAAHLSGRDSGAGGSWAHLDTDVMVEAATGKSVAELFSTVGEDAFREEERRALAAALEATGPAVVSAGGGVVVTEANRDLLHRAGAVVWLRARPETLARRVGAGSGRPLLGADPAGVLEELVARRAPLYEDVARYVVDVDGRSVGEVVDLVAAAFTAAGRAAGRAAVTGTLTGHAGVRRTR